MHETNHESTETHENIFRTCNLASVMCTFLLTSRVLQALFSWHRCCRHGKNTDSVLQNIYSAALSLSLLAGEIKRTDGVWDERRVITCDGKVDEYLTDVMRAIELVTVTHRTRQSPYSTQADNKHHPTPPTGFGIEMNVDRTGRYVEVTVPNDVIRGASKARLAELERQVRQQITQLQSELGDNIQQNMPNIDLSVSSEYVDMPDLASSPSLSSSDDSDSDDDHHQKKKKKKKKKKKRESRKKNATHSPSLLVMAHKKLTKSKHIYQDSGATQYVCHDESMMSEMKKVAKVSFSTGNGTREIERAGKMCLPRVDGRGGVHVLCKNAYYDPLMPINVAPTGPMDHYYDRAVLHQNGQMFILKGALPVKEADILVRGRLTKALLYRWDTNKDSKLDVNRRYTPKGVPLKENQAWWRGGRTQS